MSSKLLDSHVLAHLPRDGCFLFTTRILRMFAYGMVSLVLALYLREIKLNALEMGLLFTLTMLGDTVISLLLTTSADRFGRRKTLLIGAALMAGAGAVFVATGNFWFLLIAATIGVISPSAGEIGPFQAVEQASLSHVTPSGDRTSLFAWYNLAGSLAAACGSLVAGLTVDKFFSLGYSLLQCYHVIFAAYALIGALLAANFLLVSSKVEVESAPKKPNMFLGLHQSRKTVLGLSALFSLDAFAGGMVVQAFFALLFFNKFGVSDGTIGKIFFAANILAGLSALSAAGMAKRFGLINTMFWTHVPSNVLLILIPFMPSLHLAIIVLLLRFSISQMDVPTRNAFVMEVVSPDERSAAAGVTGVARSLGASLSPPIASHFLLSFVNNPAFMGIPFVLSGSLKIVYDCLLLGKFQSLKHTGKVAKISPAAEAPAAIASSPAAAAEMSPQQNPNPPR